jgi:hypothetical protein
MSGARVIVREVTIQRANPERLPWSRWIAAGGPPDAG